MTVTQANVRINLNQSLALHDRDSVEAEGQDDNAFGDLLAGQVLTDVKADKELLSIVEDVSVVMDTDIPSEDTPQDESLLEMGIPFNMIPNIVIEVHQDPEGSKDLASYTTGVAEVHEAEVLQDSLLPQDRPLPAHIASGSDNIELVKSGTKTFNVRSTQESNIEVQSTRDSDGVSAAVIEEVPIISVALRSSSGQTESKRLIDENSIKEQSKPQTLTTAVMNPANQENSDGDMLNFFMEQNPNLTQEDFNDQEIPQTQESALQQPQFDTTPTVDRGALKQPMNIESPERVSQIYQAVLDAKANGISIEPKILTVMLNPSHLGTVHIELQSDEVGQIQARLFLEKAETLTLFQNDISQLKHALGEIGLDESNLSLHLLLDNNTGQQQQSEYIGWEERERMLQHSKLHASDNIVEKINYYPKRHDSGRLDIYT